MKRIIYDGQLKRCGINHMQTLVSAASITIVLRKLERYKEAKVFVAPHVRAAQRTLGPDHDLTLRLRIEHATTIVDASKVKCGGGTVGYGERDVRMALDILDDTCPRLRRVLGGTHPATIRALKIQDDYRSCRPRKVGMARESK